MTDAQNQVQKRNRRMGIIAAVVAVGMVGASFAAVPFYSMFCRVTGYGGKPARGTASHRPVYNREMTVRFDGNVSKIEWTFKPVQQTETLKVGEQKLAYFEAQNMTARTITGIAAYNITPDKVAPYFKKIQCFCFSSQTLKPGQKVEMPVIYYIDPKIMKDHDMDDVKEITLSYTFFEQEGDNATKG